MRVISVNSKNLLITGGTGSFGNEFIKKCLHERNNIERLCIYSRDELKQWELRQKYPRDKYPQLRFFLGDIRDRHRLERAFKGIDTVIHAAALKQVPAAEYNPTEFIKTNIIGSQNVVDAALSTDVENIIALSTDKAAGPINLYGATKLCSDKLMVAANQYCGEGGRLKIAVVRYGNVMGSRGSVVPFFMKEANKGTLSITSAEMTRFNILLSEGVEMVFWTLKNMKGGEIFVPKIPSYQILDLAKAIAPTCKLKYIGIRPGEKIHEEMITSSDSVSTIDVNKHYYAILPSSEYIDEYIEFYKNSKLVPKGFKYSSGENEVFLNINEIRTLIHENIDPNFVFK